jgi:GWxTD domain-containing protein
MRLRTLLCAALVAAFASSSQAVPPSAHQEWGRGPEQFLMTAEEAARWKRIGNAAEAAAFVNLFWARRDPTPATSRNEFREEFQARVDYANKNFAAGERLGGAMSDRGRALILFGVPSGASNSGGNRSQFDHAIEAERDAVNWVEWEYRGPKARALFANEAATLRFADRYGSGEFKLDRRADADVDLAAAEGRAVALAIAQPNLTAAPAVSSAPEGEADAVVRTTAAAVEEAKRSASAASSFVTFGEYVTPAGETFVPVSLYVPASARVDPAKTLTFFGFIQDESGNTVATFEEPAKLIESKADFYVDRTLPALPAGRYRGSFGLSENGKPVTLASAEMQLAGRLDHDAAGVSQLILSNNVYPLAAPQQVHDPFAFGGLKVVPKSDRTFRRDDDLWYFIELRNPGVAEPAADYVPIVGAPVPAPRVQVRIEIEGTDAAGNRKRMQAPLREVEALALKGVRGHYGIGSALPLASMNPGNYTFTMKVIDTVKKASYTLSEKFRIAE